ncbi:protein kinase domain-containing protein [Nonomuraea sp. NPDC003214]
MAAAVQPGDPARIGAYVVRGRLGAGGQGVVYLAQAPGGRPVAVKVLRAADEEAAALLRREAEVLPRMAAFCTAQVLEVGAAGAEPYVVSEFIEGPTLQQAVAARGPLRGRELHRLAVGTATALAAIHRAGVVHRDFKPGNVLLSPEGPRVIDFGIARPVGDAGAGDEVAGTPPYMAPEQFRPGAAGAAADVFAWGATMVFAASGVPPFGAGPLPALVHRIMRAEPDLGGLDGDLRELVAVCLAKDPARRPAAREVLLRLLGRTPSAVSDPLAAGSAAARAGGPAPEGTARLAAPMKAGGKARGWVVGAVASVAALVAVALTLLYVAARPGPPAAGTRTVVVPELGATLHEHPADPLRLTSFLRGSTDLSEGLAFAAGVRLPGEDTFLPVTERMAPMVSPGGDRVAYVHESPDLAVENAGAVRFTARDLTGAFWVDVVEPPLALRRPSWSPDGSRLLVTVWDPRLDDRTTGFAVVDPARRTASVVSAPAPGKEDYVWASGDTLARASGAGEITVHSPAGAVLRTLGGVRQPAGTVPVFSADGRLATLCPGAEDRACVLDAATGRRLTTLPLPAGGVLWFWYGTDHLAVYTAASSAVRAVDLTGEPVRTLAEFATGGAWTVHWAAR